MRKREPWKLFIEILHNLLYDNNQGRLIDAVSGFKMELTYEKIFGIQRVNVRQK